MNDFAFLGDEPVYRGRLTVCRARFRGPDGSEFEREFIRSSGAVSIVPVLDDGFTVVMVRQYRGAVDAHLLEIPAGKRDVEGELPVETARRELIEETGFRAANMYPLTEFYNSPGTSDQRHHLFLATGLESVGDQAQTIEEQHLSIEHVDLRDVDQLIASRVIVDAKSMIGLLLARQRLD